MVEFKPTERGLHYVDMSVEGNVVQHMLVTANVFEEKDEEEPRFGEILRVTQDTRLGKPTKLEDFKG